VNPENPNALIMKAASMTATDQQGSLKHRHYHHTKPAQRHTIS
jgi:hypothetical protein